VSRVVSVLNMKGGVGKTTICLNLGYALAKEKKKKVLIVDFDPQANASGGLLTFDQYEKHRENRKVISDIFTDLEKIVGPVSKKNTSLLTLDEMKVRAREFPSAGYIDLVPSELELSHVLERSGGSSFEDRLKLVLKGKKNQYDYVIIDCGPTYSVLTNNALKASDSVLIPVKPDPFSARGIPMLLSKIEAHNLAHDGEDKVDRLGIVFSMVDDTLVYQAGVKAEIYKEHKDVFQTEIRYTEHYSRGLIERKSIFETNAQSQFTGNFAAFVDEFQRRAGA
jgi:chromosome partitioning protein